MAFLGIDLSSSPKRASALALLDGHVTLTSLDSFKTFDELSKFLEIHTPTVVAILAAYTAYLHQENRTRMLGIPEEGQMVVPNPAGRAQT